jgi:uncharacterized membrane protein
LWLSDAGGQRNWIQVVCNGGTATVFSFLYMLEAGCREKPIDFRTSYYESTYALAVLGALACSCGDTLASELGSVWSKQAPRLVTSFRKVPRGNLFLTIFSKKSLFLNFSSKELI